MPPPPPRFLSSSCSFFFVINFMKMQDKRLPKTCIASFYRCYMLQCSNWQGKVAFGYSKIFPFFFFFCGVGFSQVCILMKSVKHRGQREVHYTRRYLYQMISTAKEFLASLGYHCPISICPQVMLSSAYDNLSWAVHSLVELLFSPTLGGLLLHTLLFRDFLIELNVAGFLSQATTCTSIYSYHNHGFFYSYVSLDV